MKRKVIQLSPTTLAITLPKKWTEINSLQKGDEVEIREEPKKLVLNLTGSRSVGEKAQINLVKMEVFEKNFISTLYQAGVDDIDIIYDNPKIIPIIQKHIDKYCIGLDIVEQTSSLLKIRSITSEIKIEFDVMYKKNIQIMVRMMGEINEAVQKEDFSNIINTRALEERENKVQNLCLRYISKHGFPLNPKRERAAYDIIREIENICDCMKRLCDLLDNKVKISKKVKDYIVKVNSFVKSFYEMYYTKKNFKVYFYDGKKFLKEGYSLLERSKGKENLLLHHLIDIIYRT